MSTGDLSCEDLLTVVRLYARNGRRMMAVGFLAAEETIGTEAADWRHWGKRLLSGSVRQSI